MFSQGIFSDFDIVPIFYVIPNRPFVLERQFSSTSCGSDGRTCSFPKLVQSKISCILLCTQYWAPVRKTIRDSAVVEYGQRGNARSPSTLRQFTSLSVIPAR